MSAAFCGHTEERGRNTLRRVWVVAVLGLLLGGCASQLRNSSNVNPESVLCHRTGDIGVEVDMVNTSSDMKSYQLSIALLDEGGSRTFDTTGQVEFLGPGERTIEIVKVSDDSGEACEVTALMETPMADPNQVGDAESCAISGVGDEAQVNVVVTNSSSNNSDFAVHSAFIDPEGVRRGVGSAFLQVVRSGESAPGVVINPPSLTEGMTCEVVHIVRSEAEGSEDSGTTESIAAGAPRTGDSIDLVGCERVDERTIVFNTINTSTETSEYFVTVGYYTESGERLGDDLVIIPPLRPNERTMEPIFSSKFQDAGCEILQVERVALSVEADHIDDFVSCEVGRFDDDNSVRGDVVIKNSSSNAAPYRVVVAFLDADGLRRGTGETPLSTIGPGESATTDLATGAATYSDGMSCEIAFLQRLQ